MEKNIKEAIKSIEDVRKSIAEFANKAFLKGALNELSEAQTAQSCQADVSGSALSDEEIREPIENALYATNRFLTTQATDLADGILLYLKDAGFTIVRSDR